MMGSIKFKYILFLFSLISFGRKIDGANFGDPFLENALPDKVNITRISETVVEMSVEEMDDVGEGIILAKINFNGSQTDLEIDHQSFKVIEKEGQLYLNLVRSLDYEAPRGDKFTFAIMAPGERRIVNGNVQDINDNPVVISKVEPPSPVEIVELKEYNDPLCQVIVMDDDEIDQGKHTFELTSDENNIDEYFSINDEGKIRLNKPLDLDVSSRYRLTVQVFDSDKIHSDVESIVVDVLDYPNKKPVWRSIPYLTAIEENKMEFDQELQIEALDGDIDLNWEIEYSIIQCNPPSMETYFNLNPSTGLITLTKEIDAESLFEESNGLMVELEVRATEKGILEKYPELDPSITYADGILPITVIDVNDNKPLCHPSCAPIDINLLEHSTQIPPEFSFTIVDSDTTLEHSSFHATFAQETEEFITDALAISPLSGSKETIFSLVVKDSEKLDYDSEINWQNPVTFKILVQHLTQPDHIAEIEVVITLEDINDNNPEFEQEEYEIFVCEDFEKGTKLMIIEPGETLLCPADLGSQPYELKASDKDVSPCFGTDSIRYRWFEGSKIPPITIDPTTGEMVINVDEAFDFERSKEEIFTAVAADEIGNGRTGSARIKFSILDVNDEPVDLRLPQNRIDIPEDAPLSSTVLDGISASDPDLDADIAFSLEINFSNELEAIRSVRDEIKWWFDISEVSTSTTGNKEAKIFVNSSISRELEDENGNVVQIDRVDVIVSAQDRSGDSQITELPLTIFITDVNNNPPSWDESGEGVDISILETVNFSEDEEDDATEFQREIFRFRAVDYDESTKFDFSIEPRDCLKSCEEVKEMMELDWSENSGNLILRRALGKTIDREETKYYEAPTDSLSYTLTVSDGKFFTNLDLSINVQDINDNVPIFSESFDKPLLVIEDSVEEIVTIQALDKDKPDRFGKVNYLLVNDLGLENSGLDEFRINLDSGVLTPVEGKLNWSKTKGYNLRVRAIDNYRPGIELGSQFATITVNITIVDVNNNPPEFITDPEDSLGEINETEFNKDDKFPTCIHVVDIDDPSKGNGKFLVDIVDVVCSNDKVENPKSLFRLQQEGEETCLYATESFENKWGQYTLKFKASDQPEEDAQLESEEEYRLEVKDVNSNSPQFLHPYNVTTKFFVFKNSTVGEPVKDFQGEQLPDIRATDDDDASVGNGIVTITTTKTDDPDDGYEFFSVEQTSQGEDETVANIRLKKALEDETAIYTLSVIASDRGNPPLSTTIHVVLQVVPETNTPPIFNNTEPATITFTENEKGMEERNFFPIAYDHDIENGVPGSEGQVIYYYIIEGNTTLFRLKDKEENEVELLQELDREQVDQYELIIFATNSDVAPEDPMFDPSNPQFLSLTVLVADVIDTPPTFVNEGIISGGVSVGDDAQKVVLVIEATDPDLEDSMEFEISSPIERSDPSLPPGGDVFILETLESNLNGTGSAQVLLSFSPDSSMEGYFKFKVKATDKENNFKEADCQIYMITAEHIVEFKFLNPYLTIIGLRNELTDILSEVFDYRCNIDKINPADSPETTIARTHFIDLEINMPVQSTIILDKAFDPEVYSNLSRRLAEIGVVLDPNGIKTNRRQEASSSDSYVIYGLIGGVGLLMVTLIIVTVSCWFNVRSLKLHVRALSATTFGSKDSGLNNLEKAENSYPNTNTHAFEGSNPIFTNEIDTFAGIDSESLGSGGSILIGVEDEEDFKSYKNRDDVLNLNQDANSILDDDTLSDSDTISASGVTKPANLGHEEMYRMDSTMPQEISPDGGTDGLY